MLQEPIKTVRVQSMRAYEFQIVAIHPEFVHHPDPQQRNSLCIQVTTRIAALYASGIAIVDCLNRLPANVVAATV